MRKDLLWWSTEFSWVHASRSLLARPVSIVITSDAAGINDRWDIKAKTREYSASIFRGFGAFSDRGDFIQRNWIGEEQFWHINLQELYGAIIALQTMALSGDLVLLRLDNTTALSYLRKRGGSKSYKLCKLAVEVCLWMMKNDIKLSLEHVSSHDNDIADMLSRFHIDFWEFSLCQQVFDSVVDFFKVTPTCDIFASKRTAKMIPYCTWEQDPNALGRDAFLLPNWTPIPYIFPPTPLLTRVVREVELRKTKAILIAPRWKQKEWFPHLQRMKIAEMALPPAEICLEHKLHKRVEAYMDPMVAFLLDGSLPDQRRRGCRKMQNL